MEAQEGLGCNGCRVKLIGHLKDLGHLSEDAWSAQVVYGNNAARVVTVAEDLDFQ